MFVEDMLEHCRVIAHRVRLANGLVNRRQLRQTRVQAGERIGVHPLGGAAVVPVKQQHALAVLQRSACPRFLVCLEQRLVLGRNEFRVQQGWDQCHNALNHVCEVLVNELEGQADCDTSA